MTKSTQLPQIVDTSSLVPPAVSDSGEYSDAIKALLEVDVGEVRLNALDRRLYATDASNYQVEPLAVVICKTPEQVSRLAAFCQKYHLPLLPRGGGTSLAGQCTNRAVVADLSGPFRQIFGVDRDGRTCRVQAGTTIDDVNNYLKSQGEDLFFAPDPATLSQATIGGCIGNNAAGARSLRYGRTSENITTLEAVLADGTMVQFAPGAGRSNQRVADLATAVAAVVLKHRETIRSRFPRLNRRNAGYALDMILDQLDAGCQPIDLNLAPLICGSEGTLAIVLAATLKLWPTPKSRSLYLLRFASLDGAIAAVSPLLKLHPTAIELMDNMVLQAAALNTAATAIMHELGIVNPAGQSAGAAIAAVLLVEFQHDRDASADAEPGELESRMRAVAGVTDMEILDAQKQSSAWQLRRSAEALLHAFSADTKPVTFVEDNAIPVAQLSHFVHGVEEIVSRHNTSAAYYAHASVGVLHIRPLLNLHSADGREAMVNIAVEVARLARDCGGVMSGEHGDGRVRGPLLEEFFGSEIMEAFVKIKQIFDPAGILNPGMIVGAGKPASIAQQLRFDQISPTAVSKLQPIFDYAEQGTWVGAVEMCNGAGFCRKLGPGTMCPSYRATLDEKHSPRGRANALNFAMLSPVGEPKLNDPDTLATLDLCLSCKACKTECPSNVDIGKLKAEYYAATYRAVGHIPLAAQFVGRIRLLNQLASYMPLIANGVTQAGWFRRWILPRLGITPEHPLPLFQKHLQRRLRQAGIPSRRPGRPCVVLFLDCFTGYTDSPVGVAAVNLLQRMDYDIVVANAGCCGRSMMSVGMLEMARDTATRTLRRLHSYARELAPEAILFLEPSCQSAAIDDWKVLLSAVDREKLTSLPPLLSVEEFVARRTDLLKHNKRTSALMTPVIFHGHCHQKALWGTQAMQQLLSQFADGHGQILPTGCCGLAGAFGYGLKRYEVSKAIFAAPEFDPIRRSNETDMILASGTSCRAQIRHLSGRNAMHPVEWLDEISRPDNG